MTGFLLSSRRRTPIKTMAKILSISIFLPITLIYSAPVHSSSISTSSSSSTSSFSSDKSVLLESSYDSSSSLSSPMNSHSIPNNKLPLQPILSFPPMHCLKDSDCIGKNTSSKIFYDPNGRCDIRQNLCVCRDSKRYKRVQIKVNVKTTTTTMTTQNNSIQYRDASIITTTNSRQNNVNSQYSYPNNNNQQQTIVYVSKCLLQDSSSSTNSLIIDDETVSISTIFRSHYYGQPCEDDRQCSANMICRQLIVTNKVQKNNSTNSSTTSAAANLAKMLTANRTKRCRCPMGQHWNKYIRRCEWIHSNSLFQFGLAPPSTSIDHHHLMEQQPYHGANGGISHHYPGGAAGNNLINGMGSFGSSNLGGSSVHPITASNIDLKIFEVVLEIAFLVACLLGYKACSSICCKDDQQNDSGAASCNTDGCYGSSDERDSFTGVGGGGVGDRDGDNGCDLKSDEESILSSSMMKSSSISMTAGSNKTGRVGLGNSVPNLMSSIKGGNSASSTNYERHGSHSFRNNNPKPTNSVKTARRMSRKRRMSRFCARTMARRNSTYSPYYGGLGSSSSGYYTNQNFRRLSSVSSSATSRSSSASTRNLLVKIANASDTAKSLSVSTILAPPNTSNNNNGGTGGSSRTSSPCYNCRIYKEVYSPSARCKSCRSSLLSVATSTVDLDNNSSDHPTTKNSLIDFDSLMLMVGGGACVGNTNNANAGSTDRLSTASSSLDSSNHHSSLNHNNNKSSSILLPPPYKQKPIRRSEEVGVPPHLRAPYRDSQPFWLK